MQKLCSMVNVTFRQTLFGFSLAMDRPISKPKKNRTKAFIPACFVVFLIFASLYIFSDSSKLSVKKSTVSIRYVQSGPFAVSIIGNGTVVPRDINYLIPKSSGELQAVNIDSGSWVKKGQVLFVLKNEELLLERGNREIALAEAKAAHASKAFDLETNKLALQRAMLQAKSAFKVQEEEYLANKILFETDNPPISKLKYRQSEIKARELQEVYELERTRLDNFSKSMQSQLHQYQAKINLAEINLVRVNERIDDLALRSKIDGVIQDVEVKAGQRVEVGDVLGLVYDPAEVYIRLKVSAIQGHRLKQGQQAIVVVGTQEREGAVVRIDPNVKGTTIDVDIELENSESLRSNMFVSGKVIIEQIEDALFVEAPSNTVESSTSSFYKVVDGGNYAKRSPVVTGLLAAGRIQVKSGLSAGDAVVVSGVEQFKDANLVKFN